MLTSELYGYFFFNDTATTEIYTLSLHDALPISGADHLKALALVSRLMRDKGVCEKLRGSDSEEALYALLTDQTAHQAA